jgi:hypothetical protein
MHNVQKISNCINSTLNYAMAIFATAFAVDYSLSNPTIADHKDRAA